MKQHSTLLLIFVFNLLLLYVLAKGGRGGRGGLGSLFGNSRRNRYSSSPALSERRKHTSREARYRKEREHNPKVNGNAIGGIQRQQIHYNPTIPNGGTFYANQAAIPNGAVFVPHTPQYTAASKTSDFSDFFTGYLTGRLLTSGLHHTHHHHYHQVNNDSQQQTTKTIVIVENATNDNNDNASKFWPTDSDALSPFNESLLNEEMYKPTTESFFKRLFYGQNNYLTSSQPTPQTSTSNSIPTEHPSAGVICMPMLFNETDATDQHKIVQVEKLVCFPAAPPPPPKDNNKTDCFETNPLLVLPWEKTVITRKHCNSGKPERTDVVGDINSNENQAMNSQN